MFTRPCRTPITLAIVVLAATLVAASGADAQSPTVVPDHAIGAHAVTTAEPGSRPVFELKAIVGYSGFIDESMINYATVGGAVRWLVASRVGAEMEVLHLRGAGQDRGWVFLPALTFDLGVSGPVVPYVVGGAGWLRSTQPVGTGLYTSTSWTGGGGAGVRVALSPATSLSVEARLGTEPFTRVTAAVGWRFGTRH